MAASKAAAAPAAPPRSSPAQQQQYVDAREGVVPRHQVHRRLQPLDGRPRSGEPLARAGQVKEVGDGLQVLVHLPGERRSAALGHGRPGNMEIALIVGQLKLLPGQGAYIACQLAHALCASAWSLDLMRAHVIAETHGPGLGVASDKGPPEGAAHHQQRVADGVHHMGGA